MYVGPWQEYAIAKTRNKNETKSKLASKFREDLEAAIINSLDPVSAARAMKAMEKVIRKSDVPFTVDDIDGGNRGKRRRPKVLPGQHNLAAYKLQLPSVSPNSVNNGQESGRGDVLTPSSVRTSASEPVNSQRRSSFSPRANARKNVEVAMRDEDNEGNDGEDGDETSIASQHSHISSISIRKSTNSGRVEEKVAGVDGGGNTASSSCKAVKPYRSLSDHMSQLEDNDEYHQTLPGDGKGLGAVRPQREAANAALEKKWGQQPPYNTSAAVTALRLARAEAADKMRPTNLTYQAYWEWSKHKGQSPRDGTGRDQAQLTDRLESSEGLVAARGGRDGRTREDDIVNKIERVKRMQQLYNSGKAGEGGAADSQASNATSLDEAIANTTAPPTPNLVGYQVVNPKEKLMSPLLGRKRIGAGSSPGGSALLQQQGSEIVGTALPRTDSLHMPATPVISDMNLTDRELTMISKYFTDANGAGQGYDAGVDEGSVRQGASNEELGDTPSASMLGLPPVTLDPDDPDEDDPDSNRDSPADFDLTLTPKIGVSVTRKLPLSASSLTSGGSSVGGTAASADRAMADLIYDDKVVHTQHGPGPMDELYSGGGHDSLLDWSTNLNMDAL